MTWYYLYHVFLYYNVRRDEDIKSGEPCSEVKICPFNLDWPLGGSSFQASHGPEMVHVTLTCPEGKLSGLALHCTSLSVPLLNYS